MHKYGTELMLMLARAPYQPYQYRIKEGHRGRGPRPEAFQGLNPGPAPALTSEAEHAEHVRVTTGITLRNRRCLC